MDLHRILNTVNTTRHHARLTGKVAPPAPEPPPEVIPWRATFEYGRDYFHGLDEIGLSGHAIDDAKVRKAAREAWQRYGAEFLRTREPNPHRDKPWALRKWGEPPVINGQALDGT